MKIGMLTQPTDRFISSKNCIATVIRFVLAVAINISKLPLPVLNPLALTQVLFGGLNPSPANSVSLS